MTTSTTNIVAIRHTWCTWAATIAIVALGCLITEQYAALLLQQDHGRYRFGGQFLTTKIASNITTDTNTNTTLSKSFRDLPSPSPSPSCSSSTDDESSWKMHVTLKQPMCYIHVGKTAGSMVACALGIITPACQPNSRNWNHTAPYHNTSALLPWVVLGGDAHTRNNGCRANNNTTSNNDASSLLFVVPTRNPIARMQSWFTYDQIRHPLPVDTTLGYTRQYLYLDCYDNLNDMAERGLAPLSPVTAANLPSCVPNMTCPERAWAFSLGVRSMGISNHHWYNYEYYWDLMLRQGQRGIQGEGYHASDVDVDDNNNNNNSNTIPGVVDQQQQQQQGQLPPPPHFLVLRAEYLSRDWDRVDALLGGNSTNGESIFDIYVNPTGSSELLSQLSNSALQNICAALCPEIQLYKRLLQQAVNLSPADFLESMVDLQQYCPDEPTQLRNVCPGIPTFPKLAKGDPFAGFGKPYLKEEEP